MRRTAGAAVVEMDGVSVPRRLHDVALTVDAGAVALIGANGAGKSSLLHVLAGRLRTRRGRALVAGVPPRSPAAARLRAYVPQQVELAPHLRGREILQAAARARGVGATAVREATERMGLGAYLDRAVGRMSGGMRQRIALAAGLIGEPQLWLLDEPASALDAGGLERLASWTEAHVTHGGTVVVSAHRPEEVGAFARDAVLMKDGRVVDRAPVDELFLFEGADGRYVPSVPLRRRPSPRLRDVLAGDGDA